MQPINHFDLRSFDLNVLIAFDAMMTERSVTNAAARLKIGQPAMSHNLSILRTLFQDELFVRVGTSMQPTARAMALATPIGDALRQMQAVIHAPVTFDPATAEGVVRLGFSSEVELLLLPALTARLQKEAPGIRLHGRFALQREVYRLLDDHVIDLAVGCFDHQARRYHQQPIFEQSLSCVFHPSQVALGDTISLETYLSHPHALVTLSDSLHGCLEEALAHANYKLNVVTAASDFLSVLGIVASAPLIATLPTRMALRYGSIFGLNAVALPLPLTLPDVSLVWTTQQDQDPASQWMRQVLVDELSEAV